MKTLYAGKYTYAYEKNQYLSVGDDISIIRQLYIFTFKPAVSNEALTYH
tara:strand:+ start:715 stop:861 length:147 start_codon:yes stop_codon:yes gene_type:complete